MKRFLVFPLLFISSVAYAQAARPTDKFAWTMAESNLVTAQGFRYELELDNTVLPNPLTVTCTGTTSPFDCQSPIPPITPSQHTVRVRAIDITVPNEILVGDWSDPLQFTMRATPNKPGTLKIIRGQ